jgi:hypothetical protein
MSSSQTKSITASRARARVLYGEKANVIGFARFILEFTTVLSDILLLGDVLLSGRATREDWDSFLRDSRAQGLAQGLLRDAIEAPEHLRDIADALIQLKNGGVKTANDRAVTLELIAAYESCDAGWVAPFPEIRREFIDRYGKARWPGDVQARRTLRAINIPLGEAKRGRPKGAKSKQKEYGLDKQPRKLIH